MEFLFIVLCLYESLHKLTLGSVNIGAPQYKPLEQTEYCNLQPSNQQKLTVPKLG